MSALFSRLHETLRVHPQFRALLDRHGLSDCDSLVETEAGTALRKLKTRENWRLDLDDGHKRVVRLYLKKHRMRTAATRLRAVLRLPAPATPARREAERTQQLASLGVPTMTVAAYAERLRQDGTLVAAFLTEELAGFEQLDLFLPQRFDDRSDSTLRNLIECVGEVAGRFHRLGFNHRDFYTCHFFVREIKSESAHESPRFIVHLIDLQRVQRWAAWLRRRWVVKDLAQLAYSCPPKLIGPTQRLRFFKRYRGVRTLDASSKRLARSVLRKEAALHRRHGSYRDWESAGADRTASLPLQSPRPSSCGPTATKGTSQPMRIGLVLDRFDRRLGGVEQWTAQLADRLLARGHEVHVVARSVAERELRPGLTAHPLTVRGSRVALADAAADLLRQLDLDVIHDMGFGWYCDVLQPHGGSRFAANEQNLRLSPRWLRSTKRLMTRLLPRYREFDELCRKQYRASPAGRAGRLVVAISEMVRRDLKRWHGLSDASIRLVYNGVDAERFTPALRETQRLPVRRELGVRDDQPLFLIVAHNFVLKGVPALLEAMTLIRSAGHDAVLAVVGGKRTASFERTARQLGIGDSVRFVGAVDDPSPYYVAADVYVQPTWYDPCSLVLLEALACGLPVITTRFNGAGELIVPGVHGDVLAQPDDVVSLAASMAGWLDLDRRKAAATATRTLMLDHTLERNIESMLGVYEEVAGRRRQLRKAA
ncbi:MAG: glycosyltransferase [Planctomycetaceae bacterium]